MCAEPSDSDNLFGSQRLHLVRSHVHIQSVLSGLGFLARQLIARLLLLTLSIELCLFGMSNLLPHVGDPSAHLAHTYLLRALVCLAVLLAKSAVQIIKTIKLSRMVGYLLMDLGGFAKHSLIRTIRCHTTHFQFLNDDTISF